MPEDKTSSQIYTMCIDICNVLIEYKFLRLKDASVDLSKKNSLINEFISIFSDSTSSILKSIEQESRLHEKMSKAKIRLATGGKLISFTCLKKMLYSILWPKLFYADLDGSVHQPEIDLLTDDVSYRSYVMRCSLGKLRSISSIGIKSYFDAENMRQEKLQMMLIDVHTLVETSLFLFEDFMFFR